MTMTAIVPGGRASRRSNRPHSLAEIAVDHLRRLIVNGHLEPGSRLFEPQLGEMLGISRTPIREALKLLAAEGLVELRRNRNAIVSRVDSGDLAALFEAEVGIEAFAAGLAAERMRASELRRLKALQARMEVCYERERRDEYIQINQQVHRLIVAAARNPVLAETHGRLLGRLQRARNLALATEGRAEESILEHRAILAALERRDREATSRLMARHIERTRELFARRCASRG